MKKLNNLGFTLIELLAVITIMGILMMVAVPSVSRTIENSRRDTYMDNVLTYINTVRNAVLADEVLCKSATWPDEYKTYSAVPNGSYYFKIDTTAQQTKDIMEKVATSSWGGSDLIGYVIWTKTRSGERTTTVYAARIADKAGHGMKKYVKEAEITRSAVYTNGAKKPGTPKQDVNGTDATVYACKLK